MPFKLLIATLVASCSLAACAAPSNGMPADVEVRAYLPMPRSRAEVIADLEIYRRSGLAALDTSESLDVFSKAYAEA
ncbi:DUF4148 domain-containing protein [Roseateles sp. NT4]|uniref:DUF4148 domain-containing protein n=1 Tax=Roseateles sp. NT4 TaxID=3453715 RepID=UPI003EECA7F6